MIAVSAGLLAALASALALNWGYWAQHGAASALPALSPRRPVRSLRLLFAHRRWLLGFVAGLGGWGLYLVALRLAPLSLVQAVSAGGVGVLALLAWKVSGVRPARRELAALALAIAGLAAIALSLSGAAAHAHAGSAAGAGAWVAGSLAAAAATVTLGPRLLRPAAAFGIAAGVLYAAGDVATKAALGGGLVALALAAALLVCHGLAFVVLQLGFQRGGVLATAGLSTLFTNALPIVAGLLVFGEGLPGGVAGAARVAGFVAVVVGGAGLSRGDAGHAAAPVGSAGLRVEARPQLSSPG